MSRPRRKVGEFTARLGGCPAAPRCRFCANTRPDLVNMVLVSPPACGVANTLG